VCVRSIPTAGIKVSTIWGTQFKQSLGNTFDVALGSHLEFAAVSLVPHPRAAEKWVHVPRAAMSVGATEFDTLALMAPLMQSIYTAIHP
jgi:hypothetical protein